MPRDDKGKTPCNLNVRNLMQSLFAALPDTSRESFIAAGAAAGIAVNIGESFELDLVESGRVGLFLSGSMLMLRFLARMLAERLDAKIIDKIVNSAINTLSTLSLFVPLSNFIFGEILRMTHSNPDIEGAEGDVFFGATFTLAMVFAVAPEVRRWFLSRNKEELRSLADSDRFLDKRTKAGKSLDAVLEFFVGASNWYSVTNTAARVMRFPYGSVPMRALSWTGFGLGGVDAGLTLCPPWLHSRIAEINEDVNPNLINNINKGESYFVSLAYATTLFLIFRAMNSSTQLQTGAFIGIALLLNLMLDFYRTRAKTSTVSSVREEEESVPSPGPSSLNNFL